jgi:hypothetical protein
VKRFACLTLPTALVMVASGAARADSWCVRDSAGTMAPICAFSSAQDCVHAAILGPSGSVCEHEADAARAAKPAAPAKKHRASRTQQRADR